MKITGNKSAGEISARINNVNFIFVTSTGLLLSLLLLIFTYHFLGSFFEMNDDPRYVMAMKGFATPEPYNNFVSVYKFTSDAYIFLYKYYPDIAWYGYSMYLILWGALFNIFIILYLIGFKRINFLLIILLFITIYFFIFLQNVYWINFTRPAILGTSTFLLLLAALYLNKETLKNNLWILVFPIITYFLAHVTRLDGGYLGFIFGIACSVILLFKEKEIIPYLTRYVTPVLLFILLIYFYDLVSRKSDARNQSYLEKTELIRQLIDYRNAAAYVPKDVKDTLAYNAMIGARYCSDDKVITTDFIRKLTNNSPLAERGSADKFKDEFRAFKISLNNENNIIKNLNIVIILIILFWFFFSVRKNYLGFLKYIFLQIIFITVILLMCYYMKLPARIFNPLLVVATITNILFLFTLISFEKKNYYFLLAMPILVTLFSIPQYAKATKNILKGYGNFGRINRAIFDDMNSRFENTVFIPTDVRSWEMHNATDPILEVNFQKKNCYVYLSIELSLAPETQDQLKEKFGTADHSKLFQRISEKNNVIFISSDSYNNFLRGYYYYLYNQNYYFEKVFQDDVTFTSSTGLNYYRLKRIP